LIWCHFREVYFFIAKVKFFITLTRLVDIIRMMSLSKPSEKVRSGVT
jgi:hypothetical protein